MGLGTGMGMMPLSLTCKSSKLDYLKEDAKNVSVGRRVAHSR